MDYDQARIEDAVLALLAVFSFDEGRVWKGFDFDVMDSLHSQGFISDPKGKSKSVWLTPEGIDGAERSLSVCSVVPLQILPDFHASRTHLAARLDSAL